MLLPSTAQAADTPLMVYWAAKSAVLVLQSVAAGWVDELYAHANLHAKVFHPTGQHQL
jgi:hypothetical protein